MPEKVIKPDVEWRKQLTPEQYHITREAGTERAFTGAYYDCTIEGTYECVCCEQSLFSSEAKFNSGTGWPSFSQPIKENNITELQDISHSMVRTEVICSRCNGHLGHVFSDGPPPTGLRYCINSASLKLNPK